MSSQNQNYGYDPFNPASDGGQGFLVIRDRANDCYYSNTGLGLIGGRTGVFPDGTEYKQNAADLRQYILDLEASRKLQDLNDVNFTRNVKPGDALLYNYTTGYWELTDFISGGVW